MIIHSCTGPLTLHLLVTDLLMCLMDRGVPSGLYYHREVIRDKWLEVIGENGHKYPQISTVFDRHKPDVVCLTDFLHLSSEIFILS